MNQNAHTYLAGNAPLVCKTLTDWADIIQAVLAQVHEVAHQAVVTPPQSRSQRRVALLIAPSAWADPTFKSRLHSVGQMLKRQLGALYAAEFQIKLGLKEASQHELSWSGF